MYCLVMSCRVLRYKAHVSMFVHGTDASTSMTACRKVFHRTHMNGRYFVNVFAVIMVACAPNFPILGGFNG